MPASLLTTSSQKLQNGWGYSIHTTIEQLVLALAEFSALSVDFPFLPGALDTSTPMGKAMFTIIGAMAELERNVIRERVRSGDGIRSPHGTKSGNPIGRPKHLRSS